MGLEAKLARMCAVADRMARRDLDRGVRELSRLVAVALRTGRWADLPIKTQNKIEDASDQAVDAAAIADAADYIHSRVLATGNGRVIDIRSDGDFHRVQDRILALFEERRAPRRGFVYVAWSSRPEHFSYVGKAKTSNRLNLAGHGKLAHAAATETTVSLLFPARSLPGVLASLEASVIRVVEAVTGALPELNARRERLPLGDSLSRLESLAAFLEKTSERLLAGSL